jgi:hypothetical protein
MAYWLRSPAAACIRNRCHVCCLLLAGQFLASNTQASQRRVSVSKVMTVELV